uniref:Uncharacterized protein n=1 Tax=Ditylenchus dipsaci TaxID=166011 RepID=A0A915DFF4_9BILA
MECVQDLLAWRLFVFTEEQIRCFLLPGLKPSRYKCRFTAVEGSRIRRATTVLLKNSKSKRLKSLERFISLITNRGEVYLVSTTNSRRHLHVPFTRTTDAAGIASAVISTNGELFFLRPGGSELQRASISACPTYSAPSPFKDEQFLVAAVLNNALI